MNNPFLKSNNNNRFKFLDVEDNNSREVKKSYSKPPRYNRYEKEQRYNFENSFKQKDVAIIKFDDLTAFPELIQQCVPKPMFNSSVDFKSIVKTTEKIEDTNKEKTLLPGWVVLSEKHTNKTSDKNNEPNDIMENIISDIVINSNKYKQLYNDINGDDAYDDLYYMSPVYGSDYDTLSDDNNDDDDSSDF